MQQVPTGAAADFPGGLVEPCLHVELPLLFEVLVRDNIVVLRHDALHCAAMRAVSAPDCPNKQQGDAWQDSGPTLGPTLQRWQERGRSSALRHGLCQCVFITCRCRL